MANSCFCIWVEKKSLIKKLPSNCIMNKRFINAPCGNIRQSMRVFKTVDCIQFEIAFRVHQKNQTNSKKKIFSELHLYIKWYVNDQYLMMFYALWNLLNASVWKYTNDLKICQYRRLHMKIICWRFYIKTPFTFCDMRTWVMCLFTNIQKH